MIASRKKPSPVFKKNYEALKARYPELGEKIGKLAETSPWRVIPSGRQGYSNLQHNQQGQSVLYYGQEDPWQYCIDFINALGLRQAPVTFFLGLGLGYQVDYYTLSLTQSLNLKKAIIIEGDLHLFKKALETTDLTPLLDSPDIEFYIGLEPEEIGRKLFHYLGRNALINLMKTFKMVIMPACILLSGPYFQRVKQAIADACERTVQTIGNDPFDALLGLENTLKNLPTTLQNPGINLLFRRFKNRPGVVIATGPSLRKNMHLLKGIYDRALLISVDASLKVLMEQEIKPHLVTSIERLPGISRLVENIRGLDEVYYTPCDLVVPEALDAYQGPKIMVSRNYSYYDWLGIDKGQLSMGPSTANLAFKIAEVLGCNPIILVGQDLAFGPEGFTHAAGALPNQRMEKTPDSEIREVMGNDGQPIRTTNAWFDMLKWYEKDIASYPGTCINATEGGAHIDGSVIMPLQEAVTQYCQEPFFPLRAIKEAISHFQPPNPPDQLRKLTQDKITGLMTEFQDLIDACRDGLTLKEQFEQEIYRPFKEGCREVVDQTEMIEAISRKASGLMKKIIHDEQAKLLIGPIIQPYHFNYHLEKNALADRFADGRRVEIEQVRQACEWFATVGQLIVSTKHALLRGEDALSPRLSSIPLECPSGTGK
jgi:hypothetical protein